MPISLKNTGSVLPYIRYSPQANSVTIAGLENKPRRIDFIGKALAIDIENGSPGWLLIDTGLRDWKAFPLGDDTPTAPRPNYKRGFSVLIFAPKLFGSPEVFEMCSSTGAHMSFCERLYNEAEPNFDKGTVPIVKITEAEPIQIGRGKSRELRFTIVKWIARPPEFTIALAKLKAAAGGAPDKSAGAAADGGDDFDDGSVGAGGNDFDDDGGAGGAVVDEPADGTKASAKAGKAKKGRGKAQAEPPKPSSDILDDPINDPIPY